ncbi:ankyrin repeat domain-containing protein [Modicisalibacter coralii]|uniref:ankyrin repeat domain-containing protein n=1 Tax=Modicisalibacter coralii TaxID=2304602 RepID=UPI00100A2A19|nr:ankyrin repeat domain-containing protein [Halomonas coralii]
MRLTMWLCAALLSMLTLPACTGYSKQPAYYFKDEAQLALARAAGDGDIQAMQRALDRGADPNAAGKDEMTPLFWVVTMQLNINGLSYLLEHGGDPNLTIRDKENPDDKTFLLYQAYKNPDPNFIKAVLSAGADPNTLIDEHDTLLFLSMTDKRLKQVEALIDSGADVDFSGQFGRTPLINAVVGDEYETALALLEAGADPEREDIHGRSAIDVVKIFNDRQSGEKYNNFISLLKEKGFLDPSF